MLEKAAPCAPRGLLLQGNVPEESGLSRKAARRNISLWKTRCDAGSCSFLKKAARVCGDGRFEKDGWLCRRDGGFPKKQCLRTRCGVGF